MGETILSVLGLLLSVYAAADLVSRLAFRLLFCDKEQQEYYVLPIKGEEAIEYAVRRVAMLQWFYSFKNVSFVVLDCGLTDENHKMAATLCRESRLAFLTEKEWADTLQPRANEV